MTVGLSAFAAVQHVKQPPEIVPNSSYPRSSSRASSVSTDISIDVVPSENDIPSEQPSQLEHVEQVDQEPVSVWDYGRDSVIAKLGEGQVEMS